MLILLSVLWLVKNQTTCADLYCCHWQQTCDEEWEVKPREVPMTTAVKPVLTDNLKRAVKVCLHVSKFSQPLIVPPILTCIKGTEFRLNRWWIHLHRNSILKYKIISMSVGVINMGLNFVLCEQTWTGRVQLKTKLLIPEWQNMIFKLRARLQQASASTLWQLCDDAPEWICNPFSSISIDFNESRIASVIAEWSSVDADAWCKWALIAMKCNAAENIMVSLSTGVVQTRFYCIREVNVKTKSADC